jgi:hypothetical protein
MNWVMCPNNTALTGLTVGSQHYFWTATWLLDWLKGVLCVSAVFMWSNIPRLFCGAFSRMKICFASARNFKHLKRRRESKKCCRKSSSWYATSHLVKNRIMLWCVQSHKWNTYITSVRDHKYLLFLIKCLKSLTLFVITLYILTFLSRVCLINSHIYLFLI